jgi:hypothetical protein
MDLMPDLFHPEPGRGEITKDNAVLNDAVNALLQWNEALKMFMDHTDSRFATLSNAEADKLIHIIGLVKHRTRSVQRALNKEYEDGKEQRMAERISRMKRAPRGWKTSA